MFDVLRVQENPALFFPLAAGLAAVETRGGANAARGEKPRLGLPSIRTASHLGFAVCNSTTALGLRAGWVENRGGTYRWARYYNPATGRFMSRDPEAGKAADPKTLHKYLYAGGDPVNRTDPSGRIFENALIDDKILPALTEAVGKLLEREVVKIFMCIDAALGFALSVHSGDLLGAAVGAPGLLGCLAM
jgi:RHS repeat-associated protein